MQDNRRRLGGYYEDTAAAFLTGKGLRILERNFRCRMGEIDLIARDGRYLVFVEVKYRRTGGSGGALAAVDGKKQRVLEKVALYYLIKKYQSVDVPCRFDVVGIDGSRVEWVKDAFLRRG